MKKILTNKKVIIAILIGIVIIVAAVFFFGGESGLTTNRNETKEETLERIAINYYTNILFQQLEENHSADELRTLFENVEESGIIVTLSSLINALGDQYTRDFERFSDCDPESTIAVIFPEPPFRANNITANIELNCGIDNNIDPEEE